MERMLDLEGDVIHPGPSFAIYWQLILGNLKFPLALKFYEMQMNL